MLTGILFLQLSSIFLNKHILLGQCCRQYMHLEFMLVMLLGKFSPGDRFCMSRKGGTWGG